MAKSIDHNHRLLQAQSADCPTTDRIQALLEDSLSPAESAAVEEHLSTCEHCRTQLEAEFGVPQWWSAAKEALSESSRNESHEGNSHHTDWRQLLGPTDDPSRLGRIGHYEVVGMIGRGGMGVVFKAFDSALNRYVAIKMLAPHLATSGAARKRFAREAQAAAAVVDDNVLPIYGVDQWQGVPYFVMQYSRGMTLQKRIQDQGPLELKEILRIGMQTARGLAAAHAQGLVHRDVKPSNILLDGSVERVLLGDFGLARAVDDATLTRTGTIAGTPQYMSPEQVRSGTVDARCDLFSLGCVLYALCTGRPPFRAECSYAILRQITDHEPRPVRQSNPEIPEWFEAIVAKLMAKSPHDRFASAAEVAELLEQCLAHVQQPLHSPLPVQVNALAVGGKKRKPFLRLALVGLAAAVLVIGIGISWLSGAAVPNVEGKWHDEVWGEVTLTPSTPGEYDGSFRGVDGKTNGLIRLRWSRKEGRFNGTWSDGASQAGRISLRPANGEIRGALTTVPGAELTTSDPQGKTWDVTPPKRAPGKDPVIESGPDKKWFSTKQPRLGEFVWTKSPQPPKNAATSNRPDSEATLAGEWLCVAAEKRGEAVSDHEIKSTTLKLVIAGNSIALFKNGDQQNALQGTFSTAPASTDSDPKYHAIDIVTTEANGRDTRVAGIYDIQGDVLRFAHGRTRPTGFKTLPDLDLDQRFYVFKRIAVGLHKTELDARQADSSAPNATTTASAPNLVPDRWFRPDPYPLLKIFPENPLGYIRMEIDLAAHQPAQLELELSAEQQKQIADIQISLLPLDREGKVSETTANARAKVLAILEPLQRARLNQLIWQRLGFRAFETPAMQTRLELSDKLKQALHQAWMDHTQRVLFLDAGLAELRQAGNANAEQLRKAAADKKLRGIASYKRAWDAAYLILTDKQREKFDTLRGPMVRSTAQPIEFGLEPDTNDSKPTARGTSRESLEQQLAQEKARFPLYDAIMAGENALGDKLMRAERAVYDDREAFNAENPTLAKEFQQWQRDFRSMVRSKEIIPSFTKQAEHRPLMLWAADLLVKAQVPGSSNPTLAKLREALPKDPSEEQLLQLLCDAFRSDLAQYEGALERSTIAPTKEQQTHCREAESLRALEDIQTMYIDAAHGSTQIKALRKQLDETHNFRPEAERPLSHEDIQAEEARVREASRKLRDPNAVLLAELQGTWIMTALVLPGGKLGTVTKPAESGVIIRFDDKSGYISQGAGDEGSRFTYVVDASTSPAEIDLKYPNGTYALGLITIKDGTLELQLGAGGDARPSPEVKPSIHQYYRRTKVFWQWIPAPSRPN